MIGCSCDVCRSADSRDKRLRASVLVEYEGLTILVDAGPDFRQQMLTAGVSHVDAILLTHNHKDHTGGLDDIRAFNYLEKTATHIYCEQYVEDSLRMEYSYAFAENKYPGAPDWMVHKIDEKPFSINGVEIIPIRGRHYKPALIFLFIKTRLFHFSLFLKPLMISIFLSNSSFSFVVKSVVASAIFSIK